MRRLGCQLGLQSLKERFLNLVALCGEAKNVSLNWSKGYLTWKRNCAQQRMLQLLMNNV
uniref:Uncharacterized protein n=1 Tax=Setaria viridis TaxID=4556 RepID=A0A4U6VGC6_SETVI|nr:hypothetical protein SEVIR_3G338920v2 [Setaria viridis]TKW28632.1 hypothetical protein SEVIR_3G338920v2 [Setaria viridis]